MLFIILSKTAKRHQPIVGDTFSISIERGIVIVDIFLSGKDRDIVTASEMHTVLKSIGYGIFGSKTVALLHTAYSICISERRHHIVIALLV